MDEVRPSHFSSTGAINVNKSYRTVWNATTGTWAAAPETARMRTKSKANSTMRSSVTAAVAVMAGVGGGTMAADANAQASNGNGSLVLCSPSGSRPGTAFGGSNSSGTAITPGGCGASPIFNNRQTSFQLYNNATGNGTSTGSRGSAATEVAIHGSADGHLSLLGGSGVHIMGPADFNNNVNMTNHRITGLAAGTAGTDAVNLNQLNSAIASAATASNPYVAISTGTYAAATAARAGGSATAIGANANATGTSAVALGGNTVASAQNATAIGTLSRATGSESAAVGTSANAAGANASAFGQAAGAQAVNTTAMGSRSAATADGATALGYSASAVGANAIAVGRQASTSGTYGTAIGYQAKGATNAVGVGVLADASGNASVALGNRATSTGANGIAIGSSATAGNTNTVAIGAVARAAGEAGTAVGIGAAAAGYHSAAFGANANAGHSESVAIGVNSATDRANSVSVGSASLQRQITNLAAGTANTDAVNVGQLNTAIANAANPYVAVRGTTAANATGASSIAIGDGAIARNTTTAAGQTNIAIGARANTSGGFGQLALGEGASTQNSAAGGAIAIGRGATTTQRGVALGDGASVTAQFGVALGDGSVADQQNTVSVGNATTQRRITNLAAGTANTDAVNLGQMNTALSTKVDNTYFKVNSTAAGSVVTSANSIAIGPGASATPAGAVGSNSIAIGNGAAAGGTDSIMIGTNARHSGSGATVLGGNASAMGGGAGTAFGASSSAAGFASVALGANALASGRNAVALGTGSVADADNTVSVGSTAVQRRITNLGAGTGATDAVNVSQLTGVTNALGGGAAVGANGSITNPTYNVGGTDYHNVGDALDALVSSGIGNPNAVIYDDATKSTVTLGGTGAAAPVALKNVADAKDDHDALNLGQLKNAGLVGDDGAGNLTSLAVTYDDTAKDSVTLGGTGATVPVALHNVADGVLAADSKDAVNGSQLFATNTRVGNLEDSLGKGGVIDPVTGESLAVVYDSNTKDTVTLAGAGGTTLSNVKAGVADMDAVNVSQLKDAGLIDPSTGKPIAAVTYDSAAKDTVTLGGAGATTPVALKNVADGTDRHDAINLGQLQDAGLVAPVDPTNPGAGLTTLAVTYDGTAKDVVTLKGVDGTTLSNVKAGVADMDAVNVSQLKDSGLIDPSTGKSIAAVTYDRNPDGTPNYGSVTLGNGAGPTQVKNVANATDDHDALNLGQLKDAGLVGDDGSGNLTSLAVTYDDATKTAVTLGDGATPVALHNVADGVLAADSKDAVNGSQLFATNTRVGNLEDSLGKGGVIDPVTGESLAVVYDSNTKDTVTLAGAGGTTLSNVKAGVADMDAVNVSQLKDAGLIDPSTGKPIAAVTYDSAAKDTVTLGGAGATTPVALKNVADGTDRHDAINLGQLQDAGLVAPVDPTNPGAGLTTLAVTYDGTAKDVVTLKGVDGTTLSNVKAGVADMDAVNVSQLKDSGLIDPSTGKSIAAVTYDRNPDGTPNYGTVTLGNGAGPTQIKNVATGVDDLDAVNVKQLNTGLSDLEDRMSGGNLRFVKVNADPLTGTPAVASGALAVAIGSDARATSANSLALGSGARVTGNGSVAIGYNSVANQNNVVSVGDVGRERKVVNVADGDVAFQSTDAVNGGQLYAALNTLSTSVTSKTQQAIDTFSSELDKKTKAAIDEVSARSMQPMDVSDPLVAIEGLQGNNVASLNGADPTKATAAAIGSSTAASGANAVAVGLQSGAGSNNSVAIGSFAQTGAGQDYSVAVGSNVQTNGTQAVALGANAQANGEYALAVGNNGAQAIGDGSIAVGNAANVRAGATNAVAIGTGANVARSVEGAMALGANATAGAANSIALGTNAFSDRANALSVGRAGAERQIVNVAAGTQTTDAVNVGQLKGVTDSLGGGSAVGADGKVTNPTYSLADPADASKSVAYDNVGDALSNLDGRTATNTQNITVINKQLADSGLVDPVTGQSIAAVTYDRNADGTPNMGSVTLGGAGATAPVALKNVADGTDRHDAINVGQLQDAGLVAPVDPSNPGAGLTSLAVAYDGVAKDVVTLAGAGGTTLSNVKAGVADMDAVNVSQLKDSGLIDPSTGKAIAAVTYDRNADGTPNYGSATLGNGTGPTQLKNVADAKDDGDALNLGQLKDAGLVGDDGSGNLTSMAVTYDGTAKDSVTLGGAGAAAPVALHNVADGVLAADSKDAVNGSQLFATNQNLGDLKDSLEKGGVIDPTTGESLAVVYDGAAKNSVTLGNAGVPVAIHNVAAGAVNATSHDAVNGSQLFTVSQSVADKIGGGAGVGADGSLTDPTYSVGGQDYHNVGDALGALDKNSGGNPLAVAYDSAAKDTVTLGGAGATTPVALKNVADAKDDGDALNLGQLKNAGLVGDDGAGNLTSMAVTYDGAARDKVTLAGVDGTTLSNVKAGVADMDAVNVSQLKDAGLIDPSTGKPITAVTYDSAAKDSVTLGGAGATTPVALKNVADAKDDGDALNLGQLKNAGLVGDDGAGNLTSMAVTYDGAAKDTVTLGGTGATAPVALKNVADGTDRHDAINVGQLQDAGLVAPVDPSNPGAGLTSLAVAYDGVAKDVVTLKGTDGTTLSNVKAGVADMDAVNVSQLKDAGLIDPSTGKSIAAVTYDRNPDGTPNYGSVTLGNGTGPTQLKNVADATDDGDALNLGQLKNAGLVGEDGSGKLTSMAVTYDSAAKDAVTLGGAGATTPVALKNVADGTDRNDAINLGQLQDAGLVAPVDPTNPGKGLTSLAVAYDSATQDVVTLKGTDGTTLTNVKAGAVTATSTDAINGAQLHGTAQSVADSLGGGSTVGADGKVTNPTYSLADPADASKSVAYNNVGDALSNLDGRTVTNTENITVINKQLADSGLVDPVTGQSIAAVTYDRNTDGTPNMGSVTLGGAGATAPVALKNVADGTDRHDAINLGQLQDAGLVAPVDPTNPGAGLASLAVTYGKNADGSANFDQVTLAGANGTTISNVKAGAVSATSTDAINGAQLHGVSQSVAKSLGGGASVDADGNVTNPSYKVSDKTFDNVGDAIENISNSLVHGSIGLVQQDDTTRDITVAKDTDGTTVNFAGTAGNRVLTGVAAGAVSATSVDAVNGSQLHGTAQSVADVIGGGTTVDADGKLADTAIEVNGSKYKTVAEAVQAAAQYGATDSLAVRYDLNRDGTPNYGSVTLGGTGAAPVRLTNVADGASQYDAVNFGQLSELSDRIGGLDGRVGALEQNPGTGNPGDGGSGSQYFAGTDVGAGSTTPANAGAGTGNTAAGSGATIGTGANNATVIGSNAGASQSSGVAIGSSAKSAAEGATAIGSGSNASGNQSVAIGSGANASGSNSVALGAGSTAYSDDTVSVGSIDRTRTISNVSDGVNATDVATKGQLDRAMGGMQGQVNDLSRNAYSGIAAATALTMIPGVDPGKTISFGIGGATYKGYQAVAFGGEARITQNLKMKAGVGMSSGGNTVGVGASYQW
ncbi:YadA-like family protein [Burkholderia cenocepacia]|uniref:YadA-like family protein n=1 Tax=Burkholderia cenocepacia TaxID=95486 RepID=UPI0032C23C61